MNNVGGYSVGGVGYIGIGGTDYIAPRLQVIHGFCLFSVCQKNKIGRGLQFILPRYIGSILVVLKKAVCVITPFPLPGPVRPTVTRIRSYPRRAPEQKLVSLSYILQGGMITLSSPCLLKPPCSFSLSILSMTSSHPSPTQGALDTQERESVII